MELAVIASAAVAPLVVTPSEIVARSGTAATDAVPLTVSVGTVDSAKAVPDATDNAAASSHGDKIRMENSVPWFRKAPL